MEMFVLIKVREIDLEKSSIDRDQFSTPNDLIMWYYESDLPTYPHPNYYCHFEFDDDFFNYVDLLESILPKTSRNVEWFWRAARNGNKYYLEISFEVISNHLSEISQSLNQVLPKPLNEEPLFEFPELHLQMEDHDDESSCDEYDDDSELRLIEECTRGNKQVQWERPYPAMEGDTLQVFVSFIAIASFVHTLLSSILAIYQKYRIKQKKKKRAQQIKKLRNIVIKNSGAEGHYLSPKPSPPRYYNAKTKKNEYLFIQELDDGQKRNIYISSDGKDIREMPFH